MNKHRSQPMIEPQYFGLFRLFTPFSLALLGLGLSFGFGLTSSSLSAATLADLEFTLINGDTEYSVSAVSRLTITGAVDIPATHNDLPVTEIGESSFTSSTITSVTIPNSLKVIGGYAFYSCDSLSTVTFAQGSQLTTIGQYAFSRCISLKNIDLPDSVSTLGGLAFSYSNKLVGITIPSGVTVLNNNLFSFCHALKTVTFAEGSQLTTIGHSAFLSCSALENIVLPDSVTSLGNYVFSSCSRLASITFLGAAPTLEETVFENTGSSVGGFTITIYETHEASYASWRTLYTFNVIRHDPTDPVDPVHLLVAISYDPSAKILSIVSDNEPSDVALNLLHSNSLDDQWATLSSTDYATATDATTGTVTRTLTLDPETTPSGFYRLASEPSEPSGNTN